MEINIGDFLFYKGNNLDYIEPVSYTVDNSYEVVDMIDDGYIIIAHIMNDDGITETWDLKESGLGNIENYFYTKQELRNRKLKTIL